MELRGVDQLIMTPDFDGLPNLEIFVLIRCYHLKEIHPSIGRLERLVSIRIELCDRLKMCPTITQPKKLETLSFNQCPMLFNVSKIQQQQQQQNMDNTKLRFFLEGLRKLDLGGCSLGDEEIGYANWELPKLEELNLKNNKFSRLSFSRLRLPRLKFLTVADCRDLVELSEMPSSIAIVNADRCRSIESFGDISKCKWLWKVSNVAGNQRIGEILLDSILQGNALEDYFISIMLTHQIPKKFLGRLFRETTFTLRLPDNWYIDFCGFVICVVTLFTSDINIVIEHEVEDSPFEHSYGSNEAVEPDGVYARKTFVGYVSFGSLRHTAFLNSSYTRTSVSLECLPRYSDSPNCYFGAELVPRRSKGDEVQTTKVAADYSEFWEGEDDGRQRTFRIEQDSKSSIKIVWRPL